MGPVNDKIKAAKQKYVDLLKVLRDPEIFPGPSVKELDEAREEWLKAIEKWN